MEQHQYKVGDRVWYFTPYSGTESKRVVKRDPTTGKGRYVYESRPTPGGYWTPGGEVLEVHEHSCKVRVTGEWDKSASQFRKEERLLSPRELKAHNT